MIFSYPCACALRSAKYGVENATYDIFELPAAFVDHSLCNGNFANFRRNLLYRWTLVVAVIHTVSFR
jgi:hypothetical protein